MTPPRPLLGAATGALLSALLGACKAERLGVHLPPSGADAMNLEDLQRDVWALAAPQASPQGAAQGNPQAAPQPGPGGTPAWVQQRLSQMSTIPAYSGGWVLPDGQGTVVCGQRDGRSGEAVVVLALHDSTTVEAGAVPVAALISLAKSWAGGEPPYRTLLFCAAPAKGGLEAWMARPAVPLDQVAALVVLGPLGDRAVELTEAPLAGSSAPMIRASTPEYHREPTEGGAQGLDYRRVLDGVRKLREAVARRVEQDS